MVVYRMTEAEKQLADLIWANEPLGSGQLVQLALEHMNWKKSTTYTVLKKLCTNDLFRNENSIVSSKISSDEYTRLLGEAYLDQNYEGSLPNFVAAFIRKKKISKAEVEELERMIAEYKETE
ncbi:MAG: BlaI/MecI/CopY family transcriptional regulator [Lachnospiraceae bacterium]|nr:BlaI/MecI/CopY family transcriptional regulator [Lachnospiraceae bacterium]